MTSLPSRLAKLAAIGLLALSALQAHAVPVRIDLEGTISSLDLTFADFSPLLSVGDAVSATIFFDVDPPDAFNGLSDAVDPGDGIVVPAGPVSGFVRGLAIASTTDVSYDFRGGSGPSHTLANGDIMDVDGIFVAMSGINGFTATLADYIALGTSSFTATLIGAQFAADGSFGSSFGVAELQLTRASYRLASAVPEPGSLALLGLGLVGLVATTRRRGS